MVQLQGTCATYFLTHTNEISSSISVADSRPPVKGSQFVQAVLCGSSVVTLHCNGPVDKGGSKKDKKKALPSDGTKRYLLDICDATELGSNSVEDSRLAVVVKENVAGAVHLVSNGSSHSCSLLYRTDQGDMRWLKIDSHGKLLFERNYALLSSEHFPNAVIGLNSSLWVMCMHSGRSTAEVWQSRYGVRLSEVYGDSAIINIRNYHSDVAPSDHVVVALRPAGPSTVSLLACSTNVSEKDAPTYSLLQLPLHSSQYPFIADTLQDMGGAGGGQVAGGMTSLGSMVGALKRSRRGIEDSAVAVTAGVPKPTPAKRPRRGSAGTAGVLSVLSTEMQEVLGGAVGEAGANKDQAGHLEDAAMVSCSVYCSMIMTWCYHYWAKHNTIYGGAK